MAATDVINALTNLGTLIAQTMSEKHVDWSTFLNSPDYARITGQVQTLMQSLTPNKLDAALEEITASQAKILNSRHIDQLSPAELDQYMALGNVALQVAAAKEPPVPSVC